MGTTRNRKSKRASAGPSSYLQNAREKLRKAPSYDATSAREIRRLLKGGLENRRTLRLRELLVEIAGAGNNGIVEAQARLLEAVADYRLMKRQRIADSRTYLDDLSRSLSVARNLVTGMPAGVVGFFFGVYRGPIGKFIRELDIARQAATSALQVARDHPDRQKRIDRHILACGVAVVMQDILDVKPTATRDTAENVTCSRGGARYARLLRVVLALAENDPRTLPKDLGPIIDKGLFLLRDSSMPHNPSTR